MVAASGGRQRAAQARRRAREQELIAATRALFDARGVRDAQIEDIAQAVGINRAIIYRHFSGKEELFALTLVSYLDELGGRLEAVGGGSPQKRLRSLIETFVDYGLDHPAFLDCAATLMRRPGPELLEEVSEGALFRLGRSLVHDLGYLRACLQDGVTAGDFVVPDVDLLANTLYASGLGALQLARLGMQIKEGSPGMPEIAPVSADQIKEYLVAASLALAAGPADRDTP